MKNKDSKQIEKIIFRIENKVLREERLRDSIKIAWPWLPDELVSRLGPFRTLLLVGSVSSLLFIGIFIMFKYSVSRLTPAEPGVESVKEGRLPK